MKMTRIFHIGLCLLSFFWIPHRGVAQDTTPQASSPATESAEEVKDSSSDQTVRPSKKKKGKVSREKETEGTEAPSHFQADSVIKSKYHSGGESMEVDPD